MRCDAIDRCVQGESSASDNSTSPWDVPGRLCFRPPVRCHFRCYDGRSGIEERSLRSGTLHASYCRSLFPSPSRSRPVSRRPSRSHATGTRSGVDARRLLARKPHAPQLPRQKKSKVAPEDLTTDLALVGVQRLIERPEVQDPVSSRSSTRRGRPQVDDRTHRRARRERRQIRYRC